MTQVASIADVNQAIVDLLKAGDISELGLHEEADIFYGVESRYPRFPAIAVEPLNVQSELTSTQFRMTNQFQINIYFYEGALQNAEVKRQNRDAHVEKVRSRLHSDRTLGGRVAFGHVAQIEPGIAVVAASMVMASRLTWEGISKTELS